MTKRRWVVSLLVVVIALCIWRGPAFVDGFSHGYDRAQESQTK